MQFSKLHERMSDKCSAPKCTYNYRLVIFSNFYAVSHHTKPYCTLSSLASESRFASVIKRVTCLIMHNYVSIIIQNNVYILLLTLCGLTSQKTHRGGLGLGGSVHEEAHPCFPYLVQPSFKGIDAGSIYHPLVQLIPSINHSV